MPAGFSLKLTTDGGALIYSTYMPSNVTALAADAGGSAYVGGGFGTVWKVNPAGTGLGYTFNVGGSGNPGGGQYDSVESIAVDASGNVYAAGTTYSVDLPVTGGVFQSTKPNFGGGSRATGFVSKINPAGDALVYGTYLGTSGWYYLTGMAVDASGNVYVTGSADTATTIPNFAGSLTTLTNNTIANGTWFALSAKLNATGTGLAYATRIGGSHCADFTCSAGMTTPIGIAVDASGSAWIAGTTGSNQMPLVKPLFSTYATGLNGPDHFAAKLAPSGASLAFSTLLNGQMIGTNGPHGGESIATGIALDSIGSAYIAGTTNKTDFPTTAGSFRPALPGSIVSNAFVTKINESKDTTTTLAVSPNPGAVGSPMTFTATITGNAPLGTVTFKDGAATLGTGSVSSGTAQFVSSAITGGLHAFTAEYAGDTHNNPSVSAAVNANVTDPTAPPTVTLTGVADGAAFATNSGNTYTGGSVTVQAGAAAGNLLTRVTIYLDGSSVFWIPNYPTFTIPWNLPALSPGMHTLTASAQDNQGHTTTTATVRFVVNLASTGAAPTGVAITSPTNGAVFVSPEPIALTATATPAAPKTITSVTFYQGSSVVGSASSSPYSFTWTNAAPGSYSLIALATDSAGVLAYSAPVSITVGPPQPPTVSITAPQSGASFDAPATIPITASATAAAGATIAQVEFLNGTTVLGSASTPPYAFNWTNVGPGDYSLSARATDSRTATTTSTAVPVTVVSAPPPTVSITTPTSGATYTAPASIAITASATAAAGATITQVEFLNSTTVISSASAAPYTFTWTNVPEGAYSLTARATDSRLAQATSSVVLVTVAAVPTLSITAAPGLDGSTVNDVRMLVNGSIVAPPNSGVTVNGILAALGTNGDFAVNDVPLAAGSNAITLSVTTQDGATASQTIAVNSSGIAAPFEVFVDPAEGVAPLAINMNLRGNGSAVATVELDADGDGTVDFTATGMPAGGLTASYPMAGTMRPRITFKDSSGAVLFTTTKQVRVDDPYDKYNLVKGVYADMINRLKAGTPSTALNLFFGHARPAHESIFNKLGANLPSAADQLGVVDGMSVSSGASELVITRDVAGSKKTFMIYLMKGEDGIWRIESM